MAIKHDVSKAAQCVVAVHFKADCHTMSKEQEVCLYVCCCNSFPIVTTGMVIRRLKQVCVDRMMAAKDVQERGIIPSPAYFMPDKGAPQLITPLNSNKLRFQARVLKELRKMEHPEAQVYPTIRIPDIVFVKDPDVPPIGDNIELVGDIKFPGDRWQPGQEEDYKKISGKNLKPKEFTVEDCGCAEKEDYERDYKTLPAEAQEQASALAEKAYAKLQEFTEEYRDVAGLDLVSLMSDMQFEALTPEEKDMLTSIAFFPFGGPLKGARGLIRLGQMGANGLRHVLTTP